MPVSKIADQLENRTMIGANVTKAGMDSDKKKDQ